MQATYGGVRRQWHFEGFPLKPKVLDGIQFPKSCSHFDQGLHKQTPSWCSSSQSKS